MTGVKRPIHADQAKLTFCHGSPRDRRFGLRWSAARYLPHEEDRTPARGKARRFRDDPGPKNGVTLSDGADAEAHLTDLRAPLRALRRCPLARALVY